MKLFSNKAGFSLVEFAMIIAVTGILGLAGYTIYDNQQDKKVDTASQTTENPGASNDGIPSAPIIKSTEDLTKAEKTLDDVSLENTDESAQLDAELNAF